MGMVGKRNHHEAPVRWGYTLDALDHLTRTALTRYRSPTDTDERYACVWHAIVEALLLAEDPPDPQHLLRVATRALDHHRTAELHHHGSPVTNPYTGLGTAPQYVRYWTSLPHPYPPPDAIVDHLAVQQILTMLPPRQRAALTALAAAGDYQGAATLLGLTVNGTYAMVAKARLRVLALWHQGERPTGVWMLSRGRGGRGPMHAIRRRRPTPRPSR